MTEASYKGGQNNLIFLLFFLLLFNDNSWIGFQEDKLFFILILFVLIFFSTSF